MQPSTERFSDRVGNYVKYRPSYPAEALELLARECGLGPGMRVADLGAGTGIFSALLLERGAEVFAVEPNPDMRAAAERALAGRPGFHAVAAPAEATGLDAGSVDLITAAQAFHWFDRDRARREFQRILAPSGAVALIWNERVIDGTPFLAAYEQLLKDYAPEYGRVDHRDISAADVERFFHPGRTTLQVFPYVQHFDYPGLEGRLLSSSYAPTAGHPLHEPMQAELRRIFAREQCDGQVAFEYRTRVFIGRLVD